MKKRFSMMAVLIVTAWGACLAQSPAPSLAQVAKETRDEKKTVKVFTDEDLPSRRSSSTRSAKPAAQGAASAVADKNADAEPASATAESGKAEAKQDDPSPAKGEGAIAELKKKVDRYTEERDGWKKSVQRYEDLLQNETSEFRRQTYQEALDVDRQNVELYQQKIDEVQGQLAKAQESQSSAKEPDNQPAPAGHP